jgi:hypothetical protein
MEEDMPFHDARERPVTNPELDALWNKLGRSREETIRWAVTLAWDIAPDLLRGRQLAILNEDGSVGRFITAPR